MMKDINRTIYQDIENRAGELADRYSKHFDDDEYRARFQAFNTAFKGGAEWILKKVKDNYRWRKVSEELPPNEYKNEVMPQTLCLTKSKRYGIKLLAYNHNYDVWDDEYLDDYVCDRDDIEEWKPID